MKIALSIPGTDGTPMKIDSGLPSGVPVGGLFDEKGNVAGMGVNAIQAFIVLIVTIAILVALWFIIKGGFDIIQSRGQKEALQRGRERVLYAIFGLAMIFLSFTFISIISAFFGVDFLPFLKFK
jgi:hypothetical protein